MFPVPSYKPAQKPKTRGWQSNLANIDKTQGPVGADYTKRFVFGGKTKDPRSLLYGRPNTDPFPDYKWAGKGTYWTDPRRVVLYNNLLTDKDYQAPKWLDTKMVKDAYKFLDYSNQGIDPAYWKIQPNTPEYEVLANLPSPPIEYWFPEEQKRMLEAQEHNIASWDTLQGWQQLMLTMGYADPGLENRPKGSITGAQIVSSGMAGLGTAALAGAVATGVPALASAVGLTGVAAMGVVPVAIPVGLAVAGAMMYQHISGEQIPVVGDLLSSLSIFNILAAATETIGGLTAQAISSDLEFSELAAAAHASKVTYETLPFNPMMNLASSVLGTGEQATGETVWRIEEGLSKPQKVEGAYGIDALDEARNRLLRGDDKDVVYMDMTERFGFQGYLNDYVLQTILDPMNVAPKITTELVGIAGRNLAKADMPKILGFETTKQLGVALDSASKVNSRNLLVDALPPPLNYLPPLFNKKWQSSGGVMATLLTAKEFYRTGYFKGLSPVDYIPPKDVPAFDKWFAGIDNDGFPHYAKSDSALTQNQRLAKLTPTAKAQQFLYNLVDHLKREMRGSESPIEMYKIAEVISKADPNLTSKQIANILDDPTGKLFTPTSFNSPVACADALAIRYAFETQVPQNDLRNWDATFNTRTKLNKLAGELGMDATKLVGYLNDVDYDLAGIINSKGIEGFSTDNVALRKEFGVYIGTKAVPFSNDTFQAQFISHLYNSADDFLVKRFGISEANRLKRFSNVLKHVQSIIVLGFNPRYLIYNFMNNIVSRNVSGVFGLLGPGEAIKILTEFDYMPSSKQYNFTDKYIDPKVISATWGKTRDFLSSLRKSVKPFDTLGITNKMAGYVERFDAQNAYLVGLTQAYDKLNRIGNGQDPIPDALRAKLSADDIKGLEHAIETSRSGKILDGRLESEDMNAKAYLHDVCSDYAEGSAYGDRVDGAFFEEVLTKTGIMDNLAESLKGKRTVTGVQDSFMDVKKLLHKNIEIAFENDMKYYKDYVATKAKEHGGVVCVQEFNDHALMYHMEWMQYDNEVMYHSMRGPEGFEDTMGAHRKRMIELNKLKGEALAGLVESMGGKAEPFSVVYTELVKRQELAFLRKDALMETYRKGTYDTYDDRVIAFQAMAADSHEIMLKLFDDEIKLQVELDEILIRQVGGEPEIGEGGELIDSERAAYSRKWRSEYLAERKQMINDTIEFYESLLLDNPTSDERGLRWNTFVNETYNPAIARLVDIDTQYAKGIVPPIQSNYKSHVEMFYKHVMPTLNDLEVRMTTDLEGGARPWKLSNLDPEVQGEISAYLNIAKRNMNQNLMAADSYAKAMKEYALLDYSKKTGWDEGLSAIYPYHFWFTKNMRNWAMHMIDKPAMFGNYYRVMELRRKMEKDGIPARFGKKFRMPMPFMEDWMGGGIWFDPMAQVFPPAQFIDSFDKMFNANDEVTRNAIYKLNDLVKMGEITREQSEQAKEDMEGEAWDRAYAMAEKETDITNPMTMASMMIQPAMHLTTPWYMFNDSPEDIPPTPLMRTSQATSEMVGGEETFFGRMLGIPAGIETSIRHKALGLSVAQSVFGEFGDYYIERQLANMVAEGLIDYEAALTGMIDKNGDAYKQAWDRTVQEINLRQPGFLGKLAIDGKAPAGEVAWATMMSIFPAGILPEGELAYKNQQQEYKIAWEMYKKGDKRPLTEFYDRYPEYSVRSALFIKDPEERMKQYLIGAVWNRWNDFEQPDRDIVTQALGEKFDTLFLNKSTSSPELVDIQTLQNWLWIMGGKPTEEYREVFEMTDMPRAEFWDEKITQSYKKYQEERNEEYPNWYQLQDEYYSLSRSKQGAFMKEFPELKEYFEWKKDYKKTTQSYNLFSLQKKRNIVLKIN